MSDDRSDAAPGGNDLAPTRFALAPALRARLLGVTLVVLGLLVAVAVLLAVVVEGAGPVVGGVLVLVAVAVLGVGWLLGLRHWVVRLDDHGYRVRGLRTAEVRSARWVDVLDLQTTTVAGSRCVVLRLRSGRTTSIPVDVLEGSPSAFVEALTAHLDRGHGYRRLR